MPLQLQGCLALAVANRTLKQEPFGPYSCFSSLYRVVDNETMLRNGKSPKLIWIAGCALYRPTLKGTMIARHVMLEVAIVVIVVS